MSYIIKSTSPFVSIKLTQKGREQLAFFFLIYIYYKTNKMKGYKLKNEDFIDKAKTVHGDNYDYSLVDYINNKTKVKIICPKHGEFEQEPNSHLKGNKCLKCSGRGLTNEEFIEKCVEKHGNKYDYSLVNYIGSFKKIKLICSIHGEFEQSSDKHVKGHGCLFCKESKGEKEIRVYLENNKIKHLQQYVFNDCRDRYPLPFDFYLPNYNMCIEFDGRQHFEAVDRWGGLNGLLDQQKKDGIKNKYCLDNNIKLLRIAHNENIINKLKCHIL